MSASPRRRSDVDDPLVDHRSSDPADRSGRRPGGAPTDERPDRSDLAGGQPGDHADGVLEGDTLAHPGAYRSTGEQVVAAAIFGGLTAAVALIGSLATSGGQDWYDGLDRPFITPPDATFGIVWTILYVLVAAAGWLAWRSTESRIPTILWAAQLALNLLWSSVFFGLETVGGGMLVVTALLVVVIVTTIILWRAAAIAGALFVPYLAWVAFAFVLNAGFAAENFR